MELPDATGSTWLSAALVVGFVSLAVVIAVLMYGRSTSVVVRIAARLLTKDSQERSDRVEEWLRHNEDMKPSERPAHAISLMLLGLRRVAVEAVTVLSERATHRLSSGIRIARRQRRIFAGALDGGQAQRIAAMLDVTAGHSSLDFVFSVANTSRSPVTSVNAWLCSENAADSIASFAEVPSLEAGHRTAARIGVPDTASELRVYYTFVDAAGTTWHHWSNTVSIDAETTGPEDDEPPT